MFTFWGSTLWLWKSPDEGVHIIRGSTARQPLQKVKGYLIPKVSPSPMVICIFLVLFRMALLSFFMTLTGPLGFLSSTSFHVMLPRILHMHILYSYGSWIMLCSQSFSYANCRTLSFNAYSWGWFDYCSSKGFILKRFVQFFTVNQGRAYVGSPNFQNNLIVIVSGSYHVHQHQPQSSLRDLTNSW